MTMNIEPAQKRVFYIERYGDRYEVVKVWEPGARITQADMAMAFGRVMLTSPDERIVAEQSISISRSAQGVMLQSHDPETLRQATQATDLLLQGHRPPPADEDQAER
jgi:hypothetical protein